jgi:hypothetical protein
MGNIAQAQHNRLSADFQKVDGVKREMLTLRNIYDGSSGEWEEEA